jgi:hypothetical protein
MFRYTNSLTFLGKTSCNPNLNPYMSIKTTLLKGT